MKKQILKKRGVSGVAYLIAIVAILGAVAVGAAMMRSGSSTSSGPTNPTATNTPTPVGSSTDMYSWGSNSQKQSLFDLVTPSATPTFAPKPLPTIPEPIVITPTPTVVNTDPVPTKPTANGCTYPSQILDLTNWKETLPIGSSSPIEIVQPSLSTYSITPWFMVNSTCDAVQFRAHTSAPVTTSTSNYPRSELREMINNGTTNASWSTGSGIHTMFIDEAVTAVPTGKKHVVVGQIHDPSNDVVVIRLELPKLFVDINGVTGPTLDPSYTLGKRFTVKFVAGNGKIDIFYNGATTSAYTLNKNVSGCYFKAGMYTQSNCSKEPAFGATCSESNYGEVMIYNLSVNHQ